MGKKQKIAPPIPEEIKYKKRSTATGQPRAKHKHEYKTVLLHHDYYLTKAHENEKWHIDEHRPTKVCVVCGRIADVDVEFYTTKESGKIGKFLIFDKVLKPKAYELEKWEVKDCKSKNATKCK